MNLTDEEHRDLLKARAKDRRFAARPTQAQQNKLAVAQEMTHAALQHLPSHDVCNVLEAVLTGRDGLSAADLERLGNKLSRMAWEIDRVKV